MPEESPEIRRRQRACLLSILTIAVVASPVIQNMREDPDDGFPLSYYPMFTKKRDATTNLTHPIGIKRDGSEISLHYKVAGSGGMNQVRRQIRRTVRAGKSESLARDIADRIARSGDPLHADVVEVRIVTDTFDLQGFFTDERRPVRREEHAACEVNHAGASVNAR